MCTLLQSMMLLDSRHEGYEFSSISADEIMRYAAHIKNNYSEEQKERLYDIIDYMEKVFPEINDGGEAIYSQSAFRMDEIKYNHIMIADNDLLNEVYEL